MENKTKIIVLICLLSLNGCYKEEQVSPNEVILKMTGNQSSILADGVSKQLITIEIPATTSDVNNSISLTTTKGVFEIVNKNNTTVTAQNVLIDGTLHKIASVNLISPNEVGIGYVTASIKNFSKIDTINFVKAFAEQINILVDRLYYEINKQGEVAITIQINRFPGKGIPTPNQELTLVALDSTRNTINQIGNFRNFNSITDISGSCINYFSIPLTSPYKGKVKFLATIQSSPFGNIIADSTTITTY